MTADRPDPRFRGFDAVEPPEQWDDIVARSQRIDVALVPDAPARLRPTRVLALAASLILVVGLAVVVVAVAVVGRRIVVGVRAGDHPELFGPVIAYLVVISAMVVSAFGTAAPWAVLGAALFYASDATLAWNRFLEPRRWGPLAVMVTYHLGQAGLVAWSVLG